MPVYKTISPNSKTTLKIWKIEESFDYLLRTVALSDENMTRVMAMKSKAHQRGFLSVRHLLLSFGYNDVDVFYDLNGKPHLKDGKKISISHSFQFAAVIISDLIVGVDIEKQRPKIAVIANKFIDYEFEYLKMIDSDYIKKLTVIWCIKESLYKLFATPGLSFKNDILVIPFEIDHNETISWIAYKNIKQRFLTRFIEFENYTCAYVLG